MHFPHKKWIYTLGLIIIISLVLLCGIMLTKEKSVSNLYIIPAGVVSPSSLLPGKVQQIGSLFILMI
jgi:hypothetical protein